MPAYVACQAGAILLAMAITLRLSSAAGLPTWRVLAALMVLVSAATAGAVLSAPSFRPTAGLRYPGAGVGALVALPVVVRILAGTTSLLAFGDLMAAPLAFGMAVGKVGCFLHGCCHGRPSNLPWAVTFPRLGMAWFNQVTAGLISPAAERPLPVHPLQLYFAAWLVGVGMLVLRARRHLPRDGQLILLTLSLYAAGLFVNDWFKVPPDLQVELGAALMLLVTGGGLLLVTARGRARDVTGSRPTAHVTRPAVATTSPFRAL